MKTLAVVVMSFAANLAAAGCPDKLQRNPDFLALAVDDKAPRPKSTDDFKFISSETTIDALNAKVGPPDGTIGAHRFLWCLADSTVIEVESRSGTDIRTVRVNGKTTYKRK